VVGQRLHSRTTNPARQVDVDRYDKARALIDGAPTYTAVIGAREFVVRVLPDAIEERPDLSRPEPPSVSRQSPIRPCVRIA